MSQIQSDSSDDDSDKEMESAFAPLTDTELKAIQQNQEAGRVCKIVNEKPFTLKMDTRLGYAERLESIQLAIQCCASSPFKPDPYICASID